MKPLSEKKDQEKEKKHFCLQKEGSHLACIILEVVKIFKLVDKRKS